MGTTCPACGQSVAGEFVFCPFCATALKDTGAARSTEERKVVSVLFCDLVGFTAAAELADPEDVRARLRPYHDRVRTELERYGATVEKFIGDAVMAVFGAPVVHEDDAERAVRASLQLIEAMADLNAADPALSLQVRIGVNTGEAVVDLGARPELGRGIATGDVVNTASRLQGVAPVNGVAVSAATHRHTERVFDYQSLGAVQVKGKAEPLEVWQPLRPRARLGTDITRGHTTPLVGRSWERSLLTGTFERVAEQRSAALVTLVAEPGMGKSRLCAELLGYIEQRPGLVRWRQGHCLPYGERIAFWALGEIVKAECGILESDSADEAAGKLDRALPTATPDREWLRSRLAPLAGLPAEAAAQEESFTAWRRFLELLADERETVLVFEDLHWADDAFLSFLEQLSDRTRDVPLLVLCTARPELYERHPTFGVHARNAQRIDLGPLTRDETAELISSLLGRAGLADETRETLLEQAGGNPLYAGEFARLLDDQGRLRQHVASVPDSVQALIAARLDTLSPDHKSLLQDASVIGKVFWAGALAEMSGQERHLVTDALHELARKELVHRARVSSMENEEEFSFSHLLVRDVCYAQIPRAGRATRHQAAARWLERRAAERVEDVADVLAHHYLAALELARAAGQQLETAALQEKTIRYLALAADRAMGLNVHQAEANIRRALDIAPQQHPERARLLERWGVTLLSVGRHVPAKAALEDARDRYEADGDFRGASRALMGLSTLAWILGDPDRSHAARAIALLAEQPGPELVGAYTEVAGDKFVDNQPDLAIDAAQRAIALAEGLGLPEPARALGFLGAARCFSGERDGLHDMRRALDLAIERNQSRDASVIFANLTIAVSMYRGPRAALDVISEGVAFCEARGLSGMQMYVRGGAVKCRADCGFVEEALSEAMALAEEAASIGDVPVSLSTRTLIARLQACRGDVSEIDVDAAVEQLFGHVRSDSAAQVASYSGAAFLLVAAGRGAQARPLLGELAQTPANRADPMYADVLPLLVRCALAVGQVEVAHRLLAGVDPAMPMRENALASGHASIAEAEGRVLEAAALYEEAAKKWAEFGCIPEQAYALLGQGRCLRRLEQPGAEDVLTEAQRLFTALGFRPALTEVGALLAAG